MLRAGNSYYSSNSQTSSPAAGFKQYCVPIPMAPGWHDVELRYAKSPLDAASVFRFFVVDAEEVQNVYTSGVPSNQILWKVRARFLTRFNQGEMVLRWESQ
jgi:hypothetical protein